MSDRRRVVITGMGLYSPIGNTLAAFTESLVNCRHGIRYMKEWERFDCLRTKLAGVCENVDTKRIPANHRRKMGRVAHLSCLAAMDAIADAGLPESAVASPRCGVSFGSSAGSAQAQEEFFRQTLLPNGGLTLKGVPSSVYLHFMSHTCAANLAIVLHAQGPVVASSTACVSGSQGVGFGYEQLRLGRAEVMLCGGAEEMHHMDAAIFDIMLATSTHYNDRPDASPRPFDADRDGLVVGEGAGCLVLEEYEYARRRGARIYAEVLGYGTNADGYNMTNANPNGITGAILAALADAELPPDRIDYINAHATATKVGDLTEAVATRRILGEKTPVSSIKGYMGHTLGAAGAIEAIATVLMMRDHFAAPTLKCDNPDPKCGPLNLVLREPRDLRLDIAMSNNFAFGGLNTSLIFGKV